MPAKTRHANGSGTISYRPGRAKPYLAQLVINGKRPSKSFRTKTEATRWLSDMCQPLAHRGQEKHLNNRNNL